MMRMDYDINYIEPHISPTESYRGAKTNRADERLVLKIRFLATGETFRSLSFQFRIGYNTIPYIVKGVTEAIVKYVGKDYIKIPSSTNEWLRISNLFESRWNFPHCLGAIAGKHFNNSSSRLWLTVFQLQKIFLRYTTCDCWT